MSNTAQDARATSVADSIRIITLTIPGPSHRAKDAATGEEVDRSKGAAKGTASVTKPLYCKEQDKVFFDEINAVRTQIRRWFTMNTTPWGALRAMNVAEGRLERFREQFVAWRDLLDEAAVNLRTPGEFSYTVRFDDGTERVVTAGSTWDLMHEVAPVALDRWYDPEQYMPWEDFRELYRMYDFEVISVNPTDLPISISDEERTRLVIEGNRRLETRMQESSLSLANQLLTLVANMATMLAKEKPKIYETLTGNIATLCENATALNVANDPEIAAVIEQARGLSTYTASDLRASAELRKFASEEALEVQRRIESVASRIASSGGATSRILDLESNLHATGTGA